MDGRIAVLVSGSGTNLQALLDDTVIAPRIALVLSDRAGVMALQRASAVAVETLVVPVEDFPDRDAYTVAVRDALLDRDIDVVVNAGFMRVLGSAFAEAFSG